MNLADFPLIFLVAIAIPVLVENTLDRQNFSKNLRNQIILGGWIWLVYAICHVIVSGTIFGIWYTDEVRHNFIAQGVMKLMDQGRWDEVWAFASPGSNAWELYLAFLYNYTGLSNTGATIVNMFFAFWGGLILVKEFMKILPPVPPKRWPLLVIFMPSVVFWCTWNLKEGFMYWAICLVFSGVGTKKFTAGDLLRVGTGMAVGGLLRPHIITGWVLAVLGVNMLLRGKAKAALIILIVLPFAITAISSVARIRKPAFNAAIDRAYQQAKLLSERHGGSTIHLEGGKPILFVSGFENMFLRPFPWQSAHLRLLLACVETWGTTLLMLWAWLSMPFPQWRYFFKMPHMRVAILACLFFALFFSFLPNTGLVVRQRVQAVPALLVLALVPILYKKSAQAWLQRERTFLAAREALDRLSRG